MLVPDRDLGFVQKLLTVDKDDTNIGDRPYARLSAFQYPGVLEMLSVISDLSQDSVSVHRLRAALTV